METKIFSPTVLFGQFKTKRLNRGGGKVASSKHFFGKIVNRYF